MQQVPMGVWNEIAKSQPLSQPWATLFRLEPDQLETQMERLVDGPAQAMGADNRTLLAYRLTAPLLAENEAISAYLLEMDRQELRNSLPELTSVNEAVILASQEYRLNASQQKKLTALLSKLLTT